MLLRALRRWTDSPRSFLATRRCKSRLARWLLGVEPLEERIVLSGRPDLLAIIEQAPVAALQGEAFSVRYSVTNNGDVATGSAAWRDVVPVLRGNPPVARASIPGMTFQVRPRPQDADYRIPQTPHAAGLPVAQFDGSVRVIAPGVAEDVFWGMVTPASGEVLKEQ